MKFSERWLAIAALEEENEEQSFLFSPELINTASSYGEVSNKQGGLFDLRCQIERNRNPSSREFSNMEKDYSGQGSDSVTKFRIALFVGLAMGIILGFMPGFYIGYFRKYNPLAPSVPHVPVPSNSGPKPSPSDPDTSSRVLARVSGLGFLPFEVAAADMYHSKVHVQWKVFSAVPVASHMGTRGPLLALLGDDTQVMRSRQFRSAFYGSKHFATFPSGKTVPFRKHVSPYETGVTSWFAELPHVDAATWLNPFGGEEREACLTFGVLLNTKWLRNFTSCYNPSSLPPLDSQYNLTLCYPIPPMQDSKHLQFSGYLNMPQNILYHLRHGVDQVVVYLGPVHREFAMMLLKPFINRKLVTIVLLDADESPTVAREDFRNIHGDESWNDYRVFKIHGQHINVEPWFNDDCLNRFRGRTQFLANIGFDEVIYSPRWTGSDWAATSSSIFDELRPLVANGCDYDFTSMDGYNWIKPKDVYASMLLESTKRFKKRPTGWFRKIVNKPACLASIWVHGPKNCFSRFPCKEWGSHPLEYANIRVLSQVSSDGPKAATYDKTAVVDDLFFVDEARLMRKQLCEWMTEVGLACEPRSWIP